MAAEPRGERYRQLVFKLFVLLKTAQLHAEGNILYEEALAGFMATIDPFLNEETRLLLQVRAGFLFVNGVRIRISVEGFAAIENLVAYLLERDLSGILFESGLSQQDLVRAVKLLNDSQRIGKGEALSRKLVQAGILRVQLLVKSAQEDDDDDAFDDAQQKKPRETYLRSVYVAKHLMDSVSRNGQINVRLAKRIVHGIVDLMLEQDGALPVLSNLDSDDGSVFRHSVNVCVYAVLLGKQLGLPRKLLGELGVAALFHDVGKVHDQNDEEAMLRSDEEEEREHPVLGFRQLMRHGSFSDLMMRTMIVCYQSHTDMPDQDSLEEPPNLLASIVRVADAYERATLRDDETPQQALHTLQRAALQGAFPLDLVHVFGEALKAAAR